jgi:raffinose/stachyose/melibiose transport system permease protein
MMYVAAMVIPFQVVMFPLLTWFKSLGDFIHIPLLRSYQGIVFAYLGFGEAMSIFIFHGFIKGIPLELEEAADIDGCSRAGIFFNVVFPLLQPVFVTVLVLNGLWIWNDYLLPLLVLGAAGDIRTIPLAVQGFNGAFVKQWNLIMVSTLLAMTPIIILYIFAQKYIVQGMVEGSIK